jgi:hypothetical protein
VRKNDYWASGDAATMSEPVSDLTINAVPSPRLHVFSADGLKILLDTGCSTTILSFSGYQMVRESLEDEKKSTSESEDHWRVETNAASEIQGLSGKNTTFVCCS